MAVFDRGDIVLVNLEPVLGREMKGTARPALVLSRKLFNRLGDVLIAPISQGGDFSRYAGFAVSLSGTGCKTQGVALINKIRMLDLEARGAKKIETAPKEVIDDAMFRLQTLLD
jgi:mRNA interferase ChpB